MKFMAYWTFLEPLKLRFLFLYVALASLKYDPPSQDLIHTLGQPEKILLPDMIPFRTVKDPPQLLLEPKSTKLLLFV